MKTTFFSSIIVLAFTLKPTKNQAQATLVKHIFPFADSSIVLLNLI